MLSISATQVPLTQEGQMHKKVVLKLWAEESNHQQWVQ
jgi:hypothetical protein